VAVISIARGVVAVNIGQISGGSKGEDLFEV